ncbi:MAG: hypothetical protein IT236_07690 [Bacteroidia bacterium]|nr:hypothetical protein [Bacteroidia bacterium]
MNLFTNKYNLLFRAFLVSVVLVFILVRPLNSPWHRFIAGDGLGYYSYLPAKFIYHDEALTFNWFNKAYSDNYAVSSFDNPQDNFLTDYKGKKINKYYACLSFVWLPFFWCGHLTAKLSASPADGYSWPYQLWMGVASLFYLLLGLIFLRKLLFKIYNNNAVALGVPMLLFYGTHLFNYSVFYNTLAHTYSFTFMVLFVYSAYQFLHFPEKKAEYMSATLLFFVISVCIRPLNGLCIFIIPAFIPKGFTLNRRDLKLYTSKTGAAALLILGVLINQFGTLYQQTGSFFSYTYSNERFDFGHLKFFESLFSYNLGMLLYVPLLLFSLAGLFYLPLRQKLIFPLLFFGVLFLYSAWWYWPILKRCLVDYYVLPAIMIAALFNGITGRRKKILAAFLALICVVFYQFKEMQMRRGILSEFETGKELFWRNFFRTEKACIYPIDETSILKKQVFVENFENGEKPDYQSSEKYRSGTHALKLNAQKGFCEVAEYPFPELFANKGLKKIRLSLHTFFKGEFNQVHVFIRFYDKAHKSLLDLPFYLNQEDMPSGKWDLKEFGYELIDSVSFNATTVDKIGIAIWNVDGVNEFFVDDVKLEFLLTDATYTYGNR